MPEHRFGDSSWWAAKKLNRQGISLAESPEGEKPSLPPDITVISSEDVMGLLVEITSWLDFAEVQLYAAIIDEEYEKQRLDELRAGIEVENKTEKTVSAKRAIAAANPDFIEQQEKVHRAYAYKKMIETVYNRLDRQRFIVSREITRRTGGK
jgi:hypothetical protein